MLEFVIFCVLAVLAVFGVRKAVKAIRKERAIRAMVKRANEQFPPMAELSPIGEYYASTVVFKP